MVLFVVLPFLFVLGLLLIPVGILWHRRRLAREGRGLAEYPSVHLSSPGVRNALLLVGGATVLNVAILGTATHKSVEYMDSNQFCGLTCHTVMEPEYTAFLDSPHSRVGCAQCHIGPGAGWFVKSKLSGVRQVFAVARGSYSRPIPSPVHDLRPARETCEQCHWPAKFVGDKFVVRTKYADDEANTQSTTVLVLKVGGHTGNGAVGIHGRHLNDKGELVDYVSQDVKTTPAELARGESRMMDCVDCHNRPSHAFELPEKAVDRAIGEGRISRALPFVKRKTVELLRKEYADRATAERQIADGLVDYYRTTYPEVYRERRALVESASVAAKAIYLRNVFPDMKVSWGVHPNHIGHEDFLGCFRCHDESHKAKDGRTITQDCSACHTILAQDETDPKVLADLGLTPAPAP
jgi:hypothetical protein